MRKPKDEGLAKAIDKLLYVLSGHERGSVVLYSLIEAVSGYPRFVEGSQTEETPQFKMLRKKLKREARLKYQMVLDAEKGVGYRILTDEEIPYTCYRKRSKRAQRQYQFGVAELSATRASHVSEHTAMVAARRRDAMHAALLAEQERRELMAALAKS